MTEWVPTFRLYGCILLYLLYTHLILKCFLLRLSSVDERSACVGMSEA
jgi:hypothetical protein